MILKRARDRHVLAALNGGQITRDGELPLAAEERGDLRALPRPATAKYRELGTLANLLTFQTPSASSPPQLPSHHVVTVTPYG